MIAENGGEQTDNKQEFFCFTNDRAKINAYYLIKFFIKQASFINAKPVSKTNKRRRISYFEIKHANN